MKFGLIASALVLGAGARDKQHLFDEEAKYVYGDLPQVSPSDFLEGWVKAPINHFDFLDRRFYNQRYFENDKYFDKENGPMFLYICGEYTCSVRQDRLYPFMIGAQHKGLLVAVEHRFYGKSQPFGSLETENYKYLSAEQGLADLANFIQFRNHDKPNRPVVVIGCSYPGALASFFRQRYPHLSVAAWASSGSVYPLAKFWQYDEHIYTATMKYKNTDCTQAIQEMAQRMDAALSAGGQTRDDAMSRLGADPTMNNGDFSYFWADVFADAVQYHQRTKMCDYVSPLRGMNFNAQLDAMKKYSDQKGYDIGGYNRKVVAKTKITDSPSRSWSFQWCSAFGYWQEPSSQHPMRTLKYLNDEYWTTYCKELFDIDIKTDRVLSEFSFNRVAPRNAFITNSIDDPWRWV